MANIDVVPTDVLSLRASDGNTVPSITISDTTTYIDIGSGNVLKLTWIYPGKPSPDYYTICLSAYNPVSSESYELYNKSVGNVTEFYVTSSLLSQVSLQRYELNITLTCYETSGRSSYASNIVVPICKGCGMYVKVEEGYAQPIMKRAVAAVKQSKQVIEDTIILVDANNNILLDSENNLIYAKMTSPAEKNNNTINLIEEDFYWDILPEFYFNENNIWRQSDIRYEVLTDENGEIITDINDEPIYTL